MQPREKCEDAKKRTEEQRAFVNDCRRKVENLTREQIRESEGRVERFMKRQFKRYIPLRHHLMGFQEANLIKQHSKTTPESELSIYNNYTGGDGQTLEQISAIAPRVVSKAADAEEEVEDME